MVLTTSPGRCGVPIVCYSGLACKKQAESSISPVVRNETEKENADYLTSSTFTEVLGITIAHFNE